MATKAPNHIPAGMQSVTPHFWFNGNCRQAIDFYVKAFNAEIIGDVLETPDGKNVAHCLLKIGGSHIMVGDVEPGGWESGPQHYSSMGIWLYTDDCDKFFNNAVKNGAEQIMPPADVFWGDRMAKIKDPFGHGWAIATHKWIYTPEEMQEKMKDHDFKG